MRNKTKILSALFIAIFMFSGFVSIGQQEDKQKKKEEKALVDYDADVIKQLKGDSILRMIGNVIFHHNGAIIQCDSAFRYNNERIEFFGNVIINQDSTNIYGDKAVYDDKENIAKVYSPLIKLTNGESTVMYTYELTFNTKTKTGEFSGGAVVTQRDNLMESERGFYYSSVNEIKLIDNVLLRNPDYQVKTDSLKFNLDTEVTTFLTRTYIWDKEKDFLTSESGTYERSTQTYTFTHNAYIMTPDQESWGDSIIYHSATREAIMRRNIQILDTAQKTLAFGDWGYYNDSLKKAILSRKPSVRSWEEKGDTAYLRADSIYFETHPYGTTKLKSDTEQDDEQEPTQQDTLTQSSLDSLRIASNMVDSTTSVQPIDSLEQTTDVIFEDNTNQISDTISLEMQPLVDSTAQIMEMNQADTVSLTETQSIIDTTTNPTDSIPTQLKTSKDKSDTTDRLIRAFGKVRMYRKDFQSKCDSLVGYSYDSTMSLFGRPVLWNESNQITSDQMDIYTKDEQIDWADFIGTPFIVQQIDTARYNQATGKSLNAFFKDNELSEAILRGNVINYYYYCDEDNNNEVVGFLTIECAELDMFFEKREPITMNWIGQGNWAIYPIEQIPTTQSQRLDGFKWVTEGRATSSVEICNRTIKESMRKIYEAMPKPNFILEDKISKLRKELTERGMWQDRNDKTRVTPEYFQSPDRF